jgi:hypothetical protein
MINKEHQINTIHFSIKSDLYKIYWNNITLIQYISDPIHRICNDFIHWNIRDKILNYNPNYLQQYKDNL